MEFKGGASGMSCGEELVGWLSPKSIAVGIGEEATESGSAERFLRIAAHVNEAEHSQSRKITMDIPNA